jgi:large subunit ribosomal protein L9
MRVILRENIENLGKKGDIVTVARGYGRNYLIPQKIAVELTSRNMKMIEIEQKALQKGLEKEMASYQEIIDRLNAVTLSFSRKTSEKDVIFGSVSSADVRDALAALGFDVEKKKILLDEPIKRLGNFTVPIKIFHEERAEVKLEVIKEGEPAAREEREPEPDLVEEGTTGAESVEEKGGRPLVEEKTEEGIIPAEDKAQDATTGVREETGSEPEVSEEIPEEEKGESEGPKEIPQDAEAILENDKKIPEETEALAAESEQPEAVIETHVAEGEKEPAEDLSLEDTKEGSQETPEEPSEMAETELGEGSEVTSVIPKDTGATSEELGETDEDKDDRGAASKDNK